MDHPEQPRAQGAVRLTDGRRLGYAEWGDPSAVPVLFFHGALGSRLSGFDEPDCPAAGIRLVSLDRPGFGLSDPLPGRSLLDWPADVAELADQLGLGRFAVLGIAAGGPYVLACAARSSARITAAGVVAGALPPHLYGADELGDLARQDLAAARARVRADMVRRAAQVEANVAGLAQEHGADGDAYGRPNVQSRLVASSHEAFRQGVEGPTEDHLLLQRPWGFDLHQVVAPVHWWVGGRDEQNPVSLLELGRQAITQLDLTVYPGEAHAIAVTHGREMLATLADHSADR